MRSSSTFHVLTGRVNVSVCYFHCIISLVTVGSKGGKASWATDLNICMLSNTMYPHILATDLVDVIHEKRVAVKTH